MAMRGLDLQTILYRMQEIDKTQTQAVQQPRAVQEHIVHQHLQEMQMQQHQVVTTPRTEGNRIREEENERERREQRRQRRNSQQQQEEEQAKKDRSHRDLRPSGFIDVRV